MSTTTDTLSARFWNQAAEKYAAKPVGDPATFERKIAITESRMKPTDVVLDIGCGTGSLALRLAPSAAHAHGLDISTEMIRIARGKAADQGVDNVTFHVGAFNDRFDAFEPGSLDGICAYSILHLVEDRAAALARIFELLKPGGFFVSSTVCLGETWVPLMPLIAVMRWMGKAPRVARLKAAMVLDELRAAGFVDIERPDVGARPIVAFMVATKP